MAETRELKSLLVNRILSARAFARCGDDAQFYNGVHDLETLAIRLEQQVESLRAERDVANAAVTKAAEDIAADFAVVDELDALKADKERLDIIIADPEIMDRIIWDNAEDFRKEFDATRAAQEGKL